MAAFVPAFEQDGLARERVFRNSVEHCVLCKPALRLLRARLIHRISGSVPRMQGLIMILSVLVFAG
jgi:hypothetical protein